jgi:hypothetical protein
MTTLSVTQDELTKTGREAQASVSAAAQAMLGAAIAFTGEKMRLNRAEAAVALKQRNRQAGGYFKYSLAGQVAEQLATLDDQVQNVFYYDDEATPEDEVFGEAEPSPLVHLIVVVQRKTGALNSLVNALDRGLVHGFASLANAPALAHLLDVQVLDSQDVQSRKGYAALLTSVHHRPVSVLQR